jgi:hypothetical protein
MTHECWNCDDGKGEIEVPVTYKNKIRTRKGKKMVKTDYKTTYWLCTKCFEEAGGTLDKAEQFIIAEHEAMEDRVGRDLGKIARKLGLI